MLRTRLEKGDLILMGITVVVMLGSCLVFAAKKPLWNDELYSWFLLSDPSFLHMWDAFSDQINNTPPLYFLLGWPWVQVFGDSALSLRLFSALGISTALVLVWLMLRRYYSLWPVAIGVTLVFCTSHLVVEQNTEARMYGLYLATAALALFIYDRICRTPAPGNKLLLLNFLAHAALINTHLHGAFYSGALLLAMILYDVLFSRIHLKAYFSIALSWLTFLFYLPAFLVQIEVSRPRGWLPEPLFVDLTNLFLDRNTFLNYNMFFWLLLIVGVKYLVDSREEAEIKVEKEKPADHRHLIVLAVAWICVPVLTWLLSKFIQPVFWDRYFLPTALGLAILLVSALSPLFSFLAIPRIASWKVTFNNRVIRSYLPLVLSALFFLMIIRIPLQRSLSFRQNPNLAENSTLIKTNPDLPVVCQFSYYFWENFFHAPHPERYYFILDEEAGLEAASGMFGAQEYKHVAAIQRNYPAFFQDQILGSEAFLSRFDRFIVMDYPLYNRACPEKVKGLENAELWTDMHCPQWLEKRVMANPDYQITKVEQNQYISFLLVEHTSAKSN